MAASQPSQMYSAVSGRPFCQRSRSNFSHCIAPQCGHGTKYRRWSDASNSRSMRDSPRIVGVEKSALRGGAIARYSERTENLNAIRGRLELTEHLRTNAFDRSHLLCRFDERSIDNPYNQALKAVLRILLGLALSPRTRAMVAAFLHRFDEVSDRRVT